VISNNRRYLIFNKILSSYRCDVSRREDVFAVAKKVKEEVGDVTILINNAGIMPCHVFLDHTADDITEIFNVNVLAHFWAS